METFRKIQRVNKLIDSNIDAYDHCNYIKSYFHLESIIVDSANKYLVSTYKSFIEIGVGQLYAHPKVVQMFSFYGKDFNIDQLPRVTDQEILEYSMSCFEKNHYHGQKPEIFQDKFDKDIKRYFNILTSMPTGININIRSLLIVYNKLKNQEKVSLEKFTVESINSSKILIKENIMKCTNDLFLNKDTLNQSNIIVNFQKLLITDNLNPFKTYEQIKKVINLSTTSHFNDFLLNFMNILAINGLLTDEDDFNPDITTENISSESFTLISFKVNNPNKIRLFSQIFVSFICLIITTNNQIILPLNNGNIHEVIINNISQSLLDNIPDIFIDSLKKIIQSIDFSQIFHINSIKNDENSEFQLTINGFVEYIEQYLKLQHEEIIIDEEG